jgi:hypothetical protein
VIQNIYDANDAKGNSTMARKDIPYALPGESDDDYDARLKALGITDEDFAEWFEEEIPLTTDMSVQISVIGGDDSDG